MKKTLSKTQIDAVVQWMNTWDQLRDTVITMRFREYFQKAYERPIIDGPIDITPIYSLRDRFAVEALKGLMNNGGRPMTMEQGSQLGKRAYTIADQMMKARGEEP